MSSTIWLGDISLELECPGRKLEGIHLRAKSQDENILPTGSSLSFLAILDNSRVPLHLIAGPSLDVFTDNDTTESWFSNLLLESRLVSDNVDDTTHTAVPGMSNGVQSDLGVLLKVENPTKSQHHPRTTELLLYAAITAKERQSHQGMLTPPRSSSPSLEVDSLQPQEEQTARIYAIPLSSDLRPTPPLSPVPNTPTFVADSEAKSSKRCDERPIREGDVNLLIPRKRQRLDTLFSDAAEQNKRAQRKGGKTVSKLMASGQPSPQLPPQRHSRSNSQSHSNPPSRPGSRAGIPPPSRRSTSGLTGLSRVASLSAVERRGSLSPAPSPGLGPSAGAILPDGVQHEQTEVEQANKNSLSRIVMAGMRMYGLVSRKKASGKTDRGKEPEVENHGGSKEIEREKTRESEDAEYKHVYHQTFKAAAFTLRRQIAVEAIGQDLMRDTVDRLLALFCVDPRESVASPSVELGLSVGHFSSPKLSTE